MHPRTQPKQPRGKCTDDNYDVGNIGIVLRETAGQSRGEDETEEGGTHDQVEECSGGYGGGYGHGCCVLFERRGGTEEGG